MPQFVLDLRRRGHRAGNLGAEQFAETLPQPEHRHFHRALADAENFPMPMAMFALISRMFDPGIAAIASLMILMSIVIVVVLERLTGLQRAMSV